MDMLVITLVCASTLTFFILRLLYNQTQNSSKLPPGPRPYPIIGNILELGTNPHISLTKLSEIYGPIMTLKLGTITTIVISSPQLAKQVLQENGQTFSSRIVSHAVQAVEHQKCSAVWLPPLAKWRNLKRVCATKVFSTQMLDSTKVLRQEKLKELLDFVKEKSNKGEALDFGEAVFSTVLNSISNTFFSVDLTHSTCDEKSQEFKNIIWKIMEYAGKPNVADFFPILRPLDPQGVHAKMSHYFMKLLKIFDGIIEERFLKCEINFKGNNFELIPFGAGKKICPGLPLAHRSVHLMVAFLLHNFEWKLADGLTPEDMNMVEHFGLTLKKMQPLRVQAISVKDN
uniref:Cytochrome P450 n=1 Tax=Lotus japonicus TaxID=34305 RepID=I3SQ30_LOTJA|nr:unknown [Lotus japonicus]